MKKKNKIILLLSLVIIIAIYFLMQPKPPDEIVSDFLLNSEYVDANFLTAKEKEVINDMFTFAEKENLDRQITFSVNINNDGEAQVFALFDFQPPYYSSSGEGNEMYRGILTFRLVKDKEWKIIKLERYSAIEELIG
jgi:hypothetical protein